MQPMSRFDAVAYPAMRIVLAFLYLSHGLQKVFGLLGGRQMPIGSIYGIAGLIEVVVGLLIAVGLFTHLAAFIASGEMAFAYFISHAPRGGLPVQNDGEMAVALCFVFLYIATRGAGRFSVDAALGRARA